MNVPISFYTVINLFCTSVKVKLYRQHLWMSLFLVQFNFSSLVIVGNELFWGCLSMILSRDSSYLCNLLIQWQKGTIFKYLLLILWKCHWRLLFFGKVDGIYVADLPSLFSSNNVYNVYLIN